MDTLYTLLDGLLSGVVLSLAIEELLLLYLFSSRGLMRIYIYLGQQSTFGDQERLQMIMSEVGLTMLFFVMRRDTHFIVLIANV